MKKSVFRIAVTAGILMSAFTLTGCKNPVLEKTEAAKEAISNLNAMATETQNNIADGTTTGSISIDATAEFQDGIAILKDYDTKETYVVDTNYNILWSYTNNSNVQYVDGYILLEDEPISGTTTIYDKDGNQKFSYTEHQYENIKLVSNGCLIITEKTDTYNSSSTKTGLYSLEKQEYIIEPKEEYVGKIEDRGDGMFKVDESFYNSKTGKTMTFDTYFSQNFIDGYAVKPESGTIVVFDENGNEYRINEPNKKSVGVNNYNEKMLYDAYNNNLFNLETKKVISLQNQIVKTDSSYWPVFENGYALVRFMNQGDTPYYTVINTNGEFMFEPVRLEDQNGVYKELVSRKLDSGYFIVEVDGVDTVYDINNNEIVKAGINEEFEGITNGSIMANSNYQDYYKDMQGNRIYFNQNSEG